MFNPNAMLLEQAKIITGFAPAVPSSSTPDYVSLKNFERLTAIIVADNATSVTGSAVTLKQASVVAGSDEKALAFTTMFANTDTAAADALTETTVVSNTFTTDDTDNKNLLYVIEVKAEDLDTANGFDCVRVGLGNAAASVIGVIYLLWPPKVGGGKSIPSAIID